MIKVNFDGILFIVPARGGSKGIPGKNLRKVGGLSLVARSVQTCFASGARCVVVSTDSQEIALEAERFGARVVWRPPELSGDTCSSESAMRHVVEELSKEGLGFEYISLVQPTSPFLDPISIKAGVMAVAGRGYQSALTVYEKVPHEFRWRRSSHGEEIAPLHELCDRLPRQALKPEILENGAFYICKIKAFLESNSRFGDFGVETFPVFMAQDQSLQIDELADLVKARQLHKGCRERELAKLVRHIEYLFFDFDGVFTDNSVLTNGDGLESVLCSKEDSWGLRRLRDASVKHKRQIEIRVITSETNEVVGVRCRKLGIEVIDGALNKAEVFARFAAEKQKSVQELAEVSVFCGNDLNDLELSNLVSLAFCPADANERLSFADQVYRLSRKGGAGFVREVCEIFISSMET